MIERIKYQCWFEGEDKDFEFIETSWGPEEAAEEFAFRFAYDVRLNGYDVCVCGSDSNDILKFNVVINERNKFYATKAL